MKSDRLNSPDILDALRRGQEALEGESNDEDHDALYELVNVLEYALSDENSDDVNDPCAAVNAESKSARRESASDLKLVVPTYNGKWAHDHTGIEDYDALYQPVLVTLSDGVRIVLGTHDIADCNKPEIHIERRHNGWMTFLQPRGEGDTSGLVVFLDDGRSYVTPDGEKKWEVRLVDYKEAVAELDDISPAAVSCAPTVVIIERKRKVSD